MIVKTVNVPIAAIGKTATTAQVTEAKDGIVVYDLLDADGLLARSRYSLEADAPFVLTVDEVSALNYVPEVAV